MQEMVGEKAFTLRLEPQVYRRVEQLAKRERRSINAQVAWLIDFALAQLPAQSEPEQPPADRRRGARK